MVISGTGNITLNSNNDILLNQNLDFSATGSGNVALTVARDITISATSDISANSGTINVNAGRNINLSSDIITASSTADALQVSAGNNFVNSAGSNMLKFVNNEKSKQKNQIQKLLRV